MKDFSKNYIKIYFWKFVSILSGFLSMLIVVPHLSNKPVLYGIYAFCMSFTLYLTYADIGFLSSGQKYAAEEYAKGNKEEEVKILGFIGAVLLLMILPFFVGMVFLSFYPELMLNQLNEETRKIAKYLFLILGIFSPFTIVLQRLVQSILVIRIKDYIYQRIDVVANFIKIASVYYFFNSDRYLLVEYFVFITVITILANLLSVLIIKREEKYDFIALFKSLKLSKKYFNKLKKLAYSSISLTIGWILYYELDLIFIGKFMTPTDVAFYSIGFTFLNFLRNLYNVIYAPFYHRFNHFIALNDNVSLKKMLNRLIELTMPICIIVTLLIIFSAKYFVIFWVGETYEQSILIFKALVLGTLFNFILIPGNHYTISKEKHQYLYIISMVLPLVFGLGTFLLFSRYGLLSFSISKSLALITGSIIYIFSIRELIKVEKIIWKWKGQILVSSILIYLFYPTLLEKVFLSVNKDSTMLILLTAIMSLVLILFLAGFILSNREYRTIALKKIKIKV